MAAATVSTANVLITAVEHRSEEHTSELQSQSNLVFRLLLEKKKGHIKDIQERRVVGGGISCQLPWPPPDAHLSVVHLERATYCCDDLCVAARKSPPDHMTFI